MNRYQRAALRLGAQVDHAPWLDESVLHLRQQVGAAGDEFHIGPVGERLLAGRERIWEREFKASHTW